jgi:transposase
MDTKLRHNIIDLEEVMSVKRKRYSKQFKLDTITAYENGEKSMAQMERELGIADGLLRRWRMELQEVGDQADAFPGNGNMPDSEMRIRQLERENAQLRQEKEILKKVLGIYSKDAR